MRALPSEFLAVAALAVSFAFAVVYRGAGENLSLLAYSSLFLLTGVVIVFRRRVEQQVIWSRVHTAAVLYLLYMALALSWSTLRENSFLMVWVLGTLPVAFLVGSQLDDRRWRELFRLLLVSGLVSALWGIAAFLITRRRASGPLLDPNAWAAMLNLLFFGLAARYLARAGFRHWQARVTELALLVLAVALFAAYSRAATAVWLAAFATYSLWVVVRGRRVRPLLAVAAISLAAYGLVHGYASQAEASHAEGYTLNVEDKAWSQRFAQWDSAWRIYLDHPLAGSGLGTFKVQYPRYRTSGDLNTLGNYVHNDYLQFLQEGGPLQLLFLLALVLLLAWAMVRPWLTSDDDATAARRTETVGMLFAMGTALLHGLLTFTLYQLPVALLLGLYLARVLQLAQPLPVLRTRSVRSPLPAPALALLALIPWSLLTLDAFSYAVVYGQKGVPFAGAVQRDPLRFHDTLRALATLRPGSSLNHVALATIYRKLMEQQEEPQRELALGVTAAVEYQRSLDANPYQYMTYVYFADLLDERPAIRTAPEVQADPVALLERAIAVAPVYLEPYTALAERYQARGERERAYRLLKERALPWVDLQYWRYRPARMRFAGKMLELAHEFGDDELVDYLEARLAEWQREWEEMPSGGR